MIRKLFQETAANLLAIMNSGYIATVEQAIELLVERLSSGGKLLVFGNGGSSADAQHICGELVGRFMKERPPLPALALSSNQSVLTALGNDYSFDTVFSRQVEALGTAGDVAWGISTSGNSANVVQALMTAKRIGLHTIGLTGDGGGKVAEFCDVLMAVPLSSTPRIQEVHLVTYHAICDAVEQRLFTE